MTQIPARKPAGRVSAPRRRPATRATPRPRPREASVARRAPGSTRRPGGAETELHWAATENPPPAAGFRGRRGDVRPGPGRRLDSLAVSRPASARRSVRRDIARARVRQRGRRRRRSGARGARRGTVAAGRPLGRVGVLPRPPGGWPGHRRSTSGPTAALSLAWWPSAATTSSPSTRSHARSTTPTRGSSTGRPTSSTARSRGGPSTRSSTARRWSTSASPGATGHGEPDGDPAMVILREWMAPDGRMPHRAGRGRRLPSPAPHLWTGAAAAAPEGAARRRGAPGQACRLALDGGRAGVRAVHDRLAPVLLARALRPAAGVEAVWRRR